MTSLATMISQVCVNARSAPNHEHAGMVANTLLAGLSGTPPGIGPCQNRDERTPHTSYPAVNRPSMIESRFPPTTDGVDRSVTRRLKRGAGAIRFHSCLATACYAESSHLS